MNDFLPVHREDLKRRGWDSCDFIFVSGDAYVDHPSFGAVLLARFLEGEGYRVGFIGQPDPDKLDDFEVLGRPLLAFCISAGNLDSMVNKYTVNRKIRSDDLYSPGGKAGKRPDRATIVYTQKVRQAFKGVPVIIGGIEASLRRFTHYDYWSDTLRRSILADSKADLLVYGMGETAIAEIARRLSAGEELKSIQDVRGTVYRSTKEPGNEVQELHSFEDVKVDKLLFAANFKVMYENTDPHYARVLVEKTGNQFIIQNPPAFPLNQKVFDALYELPFMRKEHPDIRKRERVPALKEVQFSLTHNRGCLGACSFCALNFHQGHLIATRSKESLLKEAHTFLKHPDFKGIIHDLGGPTANFRQAACSKQEQKGSCRERSCLGYKHCRNLEADHSEYLDVLRSLRKISGIRKVFIRSGIRFDYLLADENHSFLEELCQHHVSGQLKIAPEHISAKVLKLMNKPAANEYNEFVKRFESLNKKYGLKQFVVSYYISSHPGSTLKEAIELALAFRKGRFAPDQVQDFYPTPGTLSTVMYYTGINPLNGETVHIPKGEEKKMQRALLHYSKPENRTLVLKALNKAGRQDLIGRGPNCLINGNVHKKFNRRR